MTPRNGQAPRFLTFSTQLALHRIGLDHTDESFDLRPQADVFPFLQARGFGFPPRIALGMGHRRTHTPYISYLSESQASVG